MTAALVSLVALAPAPRAKAERAAAMPPEILFLGDSHLSFGAGAVYRDFFQNFDRHCRPEEMWSGHARAVAMRSFALMGVKSTALHTWVSHRPALKRMVCVPDPKWPVNARLYGFSHRPDGSYVQFGKDRSFPFCRAHKSPFEALVAWARPRLIVLYFMGNTIERWAGSADLAASDVAKLTQQLPPATACVFMTTSPVYRRGDNIERTKAQQNIRAAFEAGGNRCGFVSMLTPLTIAAIEGKAHYFRRHSNGRVKDPYHPGLAAARRLVSLKRGAMCHAVLAAMRPGLLAAVR